MATTITIGQLDPNRNLSPSIIKCFVSAIHDYEATGNAKAAALGISAGMGFQSYCKPIIDGFNEYIRQYTFDDNAISLPAVTKSGKSASSAYATFCKNSGLLDISGTNFGLSEIANKIYNDELSCEEYAFLLLCKQGVFIDKSYYCQVIDIIASIFERQDTINETDIIAAINSKYTTTGATINCRFDILINTLFATGLVKKNWKSECEVLPQAKFLFKFISANVGKMTPTPLKNTDYYAYAGKISTGFYEILDDSIRSEYEALFSNKTSNSVTLNPCNEPLQCIYYGAPGSGKSRKVSDKTKGCDVIRTTFHPDSDYSTFVGAYKPVQTEPAPKQQVVWDYASMKAVSLDVLDSAGNPIMESHIEYKFVQQAFTQAYIEAWKKFRSIVRKRIIVAPTATAVIPFTSTTTPTADFDYTPHNGQNLNADDKSELCKIDGTVLDNGLDFDANHKSTSGVIVSDKSVKPLKREGIDSNKVQAAIDEINRIIKELSKEEGHGREIENLYRFLQRLGAEGESAAEESLLGEYKNSKIWLYRETIYNDYIFQPELLLVGVYVHESLHAFFKSRIYIPEIEEAIVECCTLTILKAIDKNMFDEYVHHVDRMKYTFSSYYGFGLYLYEHFCGLDWLTLFEEGKDIINVNDPLVKQYRAKFDLIYPFEIEAETATLLYNILLPHFDEGTVSKPQYLVIEEINRGNCAQIFGDIFQLLDREDNGFSTYPINADSDLKQELKRTFAKQGVTVPIEINDLYLDDNGHPLLFNGKPASRAIKDGDILVLPNNLFIWATMNTSDQSLFPMDSAFKRRWLWEYVPIDADNPKSQFKITIGSKVYKWASFLKKANELIHTLSDSEDKQMGNFFIKSDIDVEEFKSKVMFYLWSEVCKEYEKSGSFFKDKNDGDKEFTFNSLFPTCDETNKRLQGFMDYINVEEA